jgi:hypothetical protein
MQKKANIAKKCFLSHLINDAFSIKAMVSDARMTGVLERIRKEAIVD